MLDQAEINYAKKRKALKELAVVAKSQAHRDIKKYMKRYKQDGELRGPYESSSEDSECDDQGRNITQYKK